jgi:hypothetical protein
MKLYFIKKINYYLFSRRYNFIKKNNLISLVLYLPNLEHIINIINQKPIILLYIINVLGYCYFFYSCYTDYYITKHHFNGRIKKPLKNPFTVFLRIHLFCYVKENLLTKLLIIFFITFKFKIIIKIIFFHYISFFFCVPMLYIQFKFISELFFVYFKIINQQKEYLNSIFCMSFVLGTRYRKYKTLSFFIIFMFFLDIVTLLYSLL